MNLFHNEYVADTIMMFLTLIILVPTIMFVIYISSMRGYDDGEHSVRTEAVEMGYGEWISDSKGKTTFKWKK